MPKLRGLTTVESLLIAAAFIIVGVIGVLTFQGIGKSAAESLRANAIVTADRGGFDVPQVRPLRRRATTTHHGELHNVDYYQRAAKSVKPSGRPIGDV